MNLEIIGFIAACVSTVSFLPQVIKIVRTDNTAGLSLAFTIIYTTASFLWLAYGLVGGYKAIIVANSIISVLAVIILVYKVKNVILKKDKI